MQLDVTRSFAGHMLQIYANYWDLLSLELQNPCSKVGSHGMQYQVLSHPWPSLGSLDIHAEKELLGSGLTDVDRDLGWHWPWHRLMSHHPKTSSFKMFQDVSRMSTLSAKGCPWKAVSLTVEDS